MKEAVLLTAQTVLVVIVSFTNSWTMTHVPENVKMRMQRSTFLTMLFVFSLAYTYTTDFSHSLIILFLFFGIKALLIKAYSTRD